MRRNDIEREAQKLLEANAVTRAPVPVEQLANALRIDVRFSAGSEDVSGALIRNGESVVIAVNSSQHENRQRFTIATNLGIIYSIRARNSISTKIFESTTGRYVFRRNKTRGS